jgi:hypothetical protein
MPEGLQWFLPGFLTRISNRLTTVAADPGMSTALHRVPLPTVEYARGTLVAHRIFMPVLRSPLFKIREKCGFAGSGHHASLVLFRFNKAINLQYLFGSVGNCLHCLNLSHIGPSPPGRLCFLLSLRSISMHPHRISLSTNRRERGEKRFPLFHGDNISN